MEDVSRVKTESSSTVPDITGFPVGASFLLEIKLVLADVIVSTAPAPSI